MNAAQPPMSARHAISCHIDVDADANATPARKPTRPSCSAPFRPKRSPMAPAVNKRPANTSEYAATTHCSCDVDAPRSRDRVGMATLRLELPTKTMSRLKQSTASMSGRNLNARICPGRTAT